MKKELTSDFLAKVLAFAFILFTAALFVVCFVFVVVTEINFNL